MPTNFEFLKEDYPDLFDWAHDMEKKVKQDPNGAINSGSKFFERIFTEKERERCDARLKCFESYGKVF